MFEIAEKRKLRLDVMNLQAIEAISRRRIQPQSLKRLAHEAALDLARVRGSTLDRGLGGAHAAHYQPMAAGHRRGPEIRVQRPLTPAAGPSISLPNRRP
jgi:hypothetical protein